MKVLRALILSSLMLFGAMFSAMAHAASSSGIWSSNEGYYLVLMEQTSTGTVVALAVSQTYQTGAVLTGTRSNDVISLKSLDQASTMSLTLSGDTYTGSYVKSGSTTSLSGKLMLAYAGNANDGIWQKTDGSNRYLVTITVKSNGANLTALIDVTAPTSSNPTVKYDVSTGAISSSTNSFVGVSLVSGNAVTMAFSGSPATSASYKVSTVSRPVTTVEQLDVSKIFSFN